MRVLIVEDEAIIALSYEEMLAEAGHMVTGVAEDMRTALHLARNTRPDLALIDMKLRDGETGNAIALALHGEHGIIPIFISANLEMVSPEVRGISLALLPKPVSQASLMEALRMAVERAGKSLPARGTSAGSGTVLSGG